MNPAGWRTFPTGMVEDYECEVAASRIPVLTGQDEQPTGWVGTLVLALIGAMMGTITVLALT
tara:strand:- start:501 stop:686 length:186 start_codon:yes stop_codon:yes gene_type:complete